MSTYTMQLREYIEQVTQDESNLSHTERIQKAREKLFDFKYPIFDESYKNVFETHFIRNFYMREIGFETEGLFKFQLETWLMINMPYFNKLFESELIKYDPLINSEMNVTHNKKNDKTQNDVKDRTQNDVKDRVQNDWSDKSQNDRIDKNQNSTINNTSSLTSDQTSQTVGSSDGTSKDTIDSTKDKTTNATQVDDNFNRDLQSNNPDSRLNITTKDGEGVITYASEIKEHNENNKKTTDSKGKETDKTTNTSTSSTDTVTDTDSLTHNTGKDDTFTNANENETLVSKTDEILNSEIDETLQSKVDETLSSKINDVEDFIQHRVGKIGVQSYPKLIQEYRESFLRIERQIFDEMNELFMLVY